MLDFFKNTQGAYFEIYSVWHFLQIAFIVVSVVLIYIFRNNLKSEKNKNLFLIIGSIILLLNRFIDIFSKLVVGTFDFRLNLPLHFCLITDVLFAVMILFKKPKMFSFVYFFALIGPLPAIIFPQDSTFFDTYQFWENMLSHHFLIILNFYALFVCEYTVLKNDYKITAILGNIIFFVMIVFNAIWNTNYIFSNTLPDIVLSTFPFIQIFYHPIFWLELCGIVVIYLAYLPVKAIKEVESPN